MKKHILFLGAIFLCFSFTACNTTPVAPSSSTVSTTETSTTSGTSNTETTIPTSTTTTTTAGEADTTTATSPSTESVTPTTEAAPITPSTPPSTMSLANLDYWATADALRVCHTQSPPFKAVTLKKGTAEYDRLLALLQRVEGAYLGISHEGLAGGFMPIFVCQGATELDRICINIHGDAQFSTDTQQETSKRGLATTYASLYAMSNDLRDEFLAFFDALEYTEEM